MTWLWVLAIIFALCVGFGLGVIMSGLLDRERDFHYYQLKQFAADVRDRTNADDNLRKIAVFLVGEKERD